MADKQYVEVANMKVQSTFDSSYKNSLPKLMKETAVKAITGSSILTVTKPTGDDPKGFSLDATVTALTKDAKEMLDAKISGILSTWPDGKMYGMLSAHSKTSSTPKTIDKDVAALIKDMIESMINKDVTNAVKSKKD